MTEYNYLCQTQSVQLFSLVYRDVALQWTLMVLYRTQDYGFAVLIEAVNLSQGISVIEFLDILEESFQP